jgi:hypothetical protein
VYNNLPSLDVVGVDTLNLYDWRDLCQRYSDLQQHARCRPYAPSAIQVRSSDAAAIVVSVSVSVSATIVLPGVGSLLSMIIYHVGNSHRSLNTISKV